jgi:hypothetical protein
MEHHLTNNREQFCVEFAMVFFDEVSSCIAVFVVVADICRWECMWV